jgi:hypothetical protein
MGNKKPTHKEIYSELLPKCVEYYRDLHVAFSDDEKYYELDFKEKLELPDQFNSEGIVLPTARDMVDTFVDHIDISNARVFVNRKGTTALSAEETEMMRKFYLGLIHRTNVENMLSPWRTAAKHYAAHGLAVFKDVWSADLWPDRPEIKEGEDESDYAGRIDEWRAKTYDILPIVIQAVNPACVMPDPSTGGKIFVIEKHDKMCFDVMNRWPKWINPKNKKLTEEVEMVSYWDNQYRCELADGEPLLPGNVIEHKYGFIPYVFIDSGLGNITADAKPEKRYVGILRYMFDLLVAESRDFSISDVILKRTAWPWGYLKGKNANKVTKIDQQFGTYNVMPDDVEIIEMSPKIPPDALNQHLYRTSDYISAHAAPRSMRGLGETGVRSGADRRLVMSEASARYRYSEDAFRNGTAKVLTNCARLMKNVIPYDVRVWARTPTDEFDMEIKKDKMKEPFTCYVEFAPISEEDEYRRHDDLERLVASGIVTRSWARTQMSNVDPLKLEREEEMERIKNDPAIQGAISQYLAGRMAEELAKRSAAESINNPPPPVAPQPMMPGQEQAGRAMSPGVPNVPPLGSGPNLQNQLAQNRSQTPMNPSQGFGGGGNRP